MSANTKSLEQEVAHTYESMLRPIADDYHYDLPEFPNVAKSKPTVILLGNHSSGKSTFINYLLHDELQKTGVAPTDDGFTLITHGQNSEESRGPGAIEREDFTYPGIDRLGPGFLSRLRVKTRPASILERVNLVDSPGMIDTADTSTERGYDFMNACRFFAEHADIILFFFDPEKPGTTGETMSTFTQSLTGFEHKLMIVLNKVDTFANIRDFARDYGSLCWNLARVVQTKDLPHIFTMYVPVSHVDNANTRIPLQDFDESREEVINEIENADRRRKDNLIGNLKEQASRLEIYVHVSHALRQHTNKLITRAILATTLVAAMEFAYLGYFWETFGVMKIIGISLLGVLLVGFTAWIGLQFARRAMKKNRQQLDELFQELYLRELTLSQRDDLLARWKLVKPRIEHLLQEMSERAIPCHTWRIKGILKKLQKAKSFDSGQSN